MVGKIKTGFIKILSRNVLLYLYHSIKSKSYMKYFLMLRLSKFEDIYFKPF